MKKLGGTGVLTCVRLGLGLPSNLMKSFPRSNQGAQSAAYRTLDLELFGTVAGEMLRVTREMPHPLPQKRASPG
jgi:hypothetical protein